jgi:amidase
MKIKRPEQLSAVELSKGLQQRKIKAVEVMGVYLECIKRLNPEINAIVSLRNENVLLDEARAADQELDAGNSKGWLHGMPLAIKDLSDVKGLPTSQGSLNHAGTVPVEDDMHVARSRATGAIFIGKTNTPEHGLGSHSYNNVFGVTRNPFDLSRSAGGSSGGAAAAVATRMLPIADGSDMMGSLRNPAAFNAVVGFRPSFGRVPDAGKDLYADTFSVVGPIGRNVEDVHALLKTQAGYDMRLPFALADDALELTTEAKPFPKARVGWLGDFDGYLSFDPEVLDVCARSFATFEAAGAQVENVKVGFDLPLLWNAWCTLRHFVVAQGLGADYAMPARRERMKPEVLWEVTRGEALTVKEISAASEVRSAWYRYMLQLFERYDFLIIPSAQVFPFDALLHWPSEVGGRKMDTYHRWMEVVIGPTMAGLPVAAMPAGFSSTGLPAGIQIIGPPRGDAATLRAALHYERHHKMPAGRWSTRIDGETP